MSALLIKNARVFAPKDLGRNDVLMVNDRIVAVAPDLAPAGIPDLEVLDAAGRILTPGFFDQHIHVTGGGGEGGPATRTPELVLSELIRCGTTSVVGVSGTDYTTRSIPNLLAKVRALQTEGVSAWMYTSNYKYPATTLTDSIANDLFFVPEVIGVKIALGDHRSSFPTTQQVLAVLAEVRVGAMIAGKTGFLHIHTGNIPGAFAMYDEIVAKGFPIKHIRPTHCGRIRHVFDSAVEFAKKGGWIDITTGASCCFDHPAQAVIEAVGMGVDPTHITLSTDGHGSVPRFNEKGEMVGLGVGGVDGNLKETIRLIRDYQMPIEDALTYTTKNVGDALGLKDQGRVETGACANACLFTEDFELTHVVARGRVMMREGEVVVKGTFEL
ncbi:beta-aspartyl-peptidase [Sutterella sp.]|uniref:beta-aspartyl-peptidase n=1 Tax=Sutterella sp. TaxID=1981025 RepID=UPI003FD8E9E4